MQLFTLLKQTQSSFWEPLVQLFYDALPFRQPPRKFSAIYYYLNISRTAIKISPNLFLPLPSFLHPQ